MDKRDVCAHTPAPPAAASSPVHPLPQHRATVPTTQIQHGSRTECKMKSKPLSSKRRLSGCVVFPSSCHTSFPGPECQRLRTQPARAPSLSRVISRPAPWPVARVPMLPQQVPACPSLTRQLHTQWKTCVLHISEKSTDNPGDWCPHKKTTAQQPRNVCTNVQPPQKPN